MKGRLDFRRSIFVEIVLLLLVAAAVALAFFGLIHLAGDSLLDSFTRRSEFNRRKSMQYAANLQEYVDEEELTCARLEELDDWLKNNPAVVLQVYDDGYLIYDSVNGMSDELLYRRDQEDTAAWENAYYLALRDKTVEIILYGNFGYAFYNTVLLVEVALSFVLFLFIIFLGIGVKTRYIVKLREEIELLESGNLDYPITVSGKDELAKLASDLDDMRISFRHQIEEAERISKTNRTMITQISHDLRTPLTALTLYAEILQNGMDLPEEKQLEYRNKILKKALHMKDLSDRLLSFATEVERPQAVKPDWIPARDAFYDELSELTGYLSQQGFRVDCELNWDSVTVCVNNEYLSRIFNNLSSNLLRYADRSAPVRIGIERRGEFLCLRFENQIAEDASAEESSGIGLRSVETMLRELGGSCEILKSEGIYTLCLLFRSYY